MEILALQRKFVEEELHRSILEEEKISNELQQHFSALKRPSGATAAGGAYHYEMSSVGSELKKVENVAPMLESMSQNAKKLAGQVEECRTLSDRLSSIVRQLDLKQMRAQKALACTEDIVSLKDARSRILSALDSGDLTTAVKYLQQVHEIDSRALDASEDFQVIKSKEADIKAQVQAEFQKAIESSSIEAVCLYCPMLQFLHLEHEARDNLLQFFEHKIFVSLSSEHILASTSATDAATAYIQALLHIFNTSYVIIQTYLPIVLQGLEGCHGDVHFLRNLHAKVHTEIQAVLKKYIKYRALNDLQTLPTADLHSLMDEIALIAQYCCKYSKYLKHIVSGAEGRQRGVTVFTYPLEFDKMVDEIVSKYYLRGEAQLLKGTASESIDTVFFVLQKVGLRAVATNSSHACLAVMNMIQGFIAADLATIVNSSMAASLTKLCASLSDYYSKYKKSLSTTTASTSITKGLLGMMRSNEAVADGAGGAETDLEVLNDIELIIAYTDRLAKELYTAAEGVFADPTAPKGGKKKELFHVTSEMDKLRAVRENFDQATHVYHQTLKQGHEKIAQHLQGIFRELFALTADASNSNLHLSYALREGRFDAQSNLVILPRLYLIPLENMLFLITEHLSEKGKENMVNLIAEVACERLEGFIKQTSFSFSGAMKMEENQRAINSLFARYSSTSVRTRFTRLREELQVLTSQSLGDSLNENYSCLTSQEVEAIFGLRVDS